MFPMARLTGFTLAALVIVSLAISQHAVAAADKASLRGNRALRMGGSRKTLAVAAGGGGEPSAAGGLPGSPVIPAAPTDHQTPPPTRPAEQPSPPSPRPPQPPPSPSSRSKKPSPSRKSPPPARSPPKPVKSPSPPRPAPPSPRPPSPSPPPRAPPAPSPPPAAPGQDPRDGEAVEPLGGGNCPDALAILNQTNLYRARHQAPPLAWSPSLAAASTVYAQKLADGGCKLKHSGGKDYGENLMMVQGLPRPDSSCMVAVKSWYSEVRAYDFDADQPFAANWPRGIGHFTQLVWRGTATVGCGVGLADVTMQLSGGRTMVGGCKIIVCRYKAPGNVATDMHFLKNVLRNTTAAVV